MKNNKLNYNNAWLTIIGIVCLLAAIVILIVFLMRGETKTNNSGSNTEKSVSLSCKVNDISYPIFVYDNSNSKTTQIDAIFSNDTLKTISLKHTLFYSNENLIERSDAHNHAAMNISLQDKGLDINILSPSYSQQKDKYVMTLYATDEILDAFLGKYFLIDNYNINLSVNDYEEIYSNQGFKCQIID